MNVFNATPNLRLCQTNHFWDFISKNNVEGTASISTPTSASTSPESPIPDLLAVFVQRTTGIFGSETIGSRLESSRNDLWAPISFIDTWRLTWVGSFGDSGISAAVDSVFNADVFTTSRGNDVWILHDRISRYDVHEQQVKHLDLSFS
ncbi:hypothetical protein WUBG_03273 [Wuchereria bancrofti]|uniref:Uncharacterized protein n=1 Tax=Wuchereria bancrofti TaxID=6293 RepID=J9ETB7_WUCBA|nr:hypothetical protein WUBG_03273 [Wuchereria bancrofti]